jgi:hypothetical protein
LDYITTMGATQLRNMNWTQHADSVIFVEKDMTPAILQRGASDSAWTYSAITFDSIPKHAFSVTNTAVAQTLTLSATTGRITATAGGGTPFNGVGVGNYINATPQGRMRITAVDSDTVVRGVVEVPFFATSVASDAWETETGYEDVWSVTRGYPRSAVFHEGRLYLGGSKSRPATIWGSKVGFPFDFMPDDGYADDAVENTIGIGRYDEIVDMLSGRDLQIFTTGGEYFVPQAQGSPVTPENFFFKAATVNGAKPAIRVQQLDSGTLYVQREGKALHELLYTEVELSYVSNKISLLSGHLLRTPTRMALRRATSTDEGDLLLIVNGEDGTMGAWMLLRSQNVIAPSLWVTDGQYLDCAVDVTDIYAVTSRTCSTVTKYYVEIFDLDLDTDCAFIGGVASSVAGIPYACKTLDLLLDGYYQGPQQASVLGTLTFPRASTIAYEVGIPFVPEVKTMPAEPRLAAGSRAGFRKRIPQVNVMLKDTRHITVNGQAVPFQRLGESLLDQPVPEFTGTKRVSGMLGWKTEAQITFSRDVPLQATVLGVDYRVAVHGGT